MKSTVFLFLLFLAATAFTACEDQPAPVPEKVTDKSPEKAPVKTSGAAAEQSFRGLYSGDGATKTFTDCASGIMYTLKDQTQSLDALYQKALLPAVYKGESVYAVVKGTLDTKSAITASLLVTKVDTVEGKNMVNCCIPYDFWCTGTEPFWDMQISQKEDGLFFKNLGAESGARYAWANPKINGATWTYDSPAPNAKQSAMKVVIKKEKCSDGMSDREFQYSVEVTRGKEKLRGCAVRWGEKMPD